jgi:hypothetical protein
MDVRYFNTILSLTLRFRLAMKDPKPYELSKQFGISFDSFAKIQLVTLGCANLEPSKYTIQIVIDHSSYYLTNYLFTTRH